jgi:hypothetical protein
MPDGTGGNLFFLRKLKNARLRAYLDQLPLGRYRKLL